MLAAGDVEVALPSIGADGRRHPGRVSRALTEARNRRIVELKAAGLLNKQIAVDVNCCVDTVRKVLAAHRRRAGSDYATTTRRPVAVPHDAIVASHCPRVLSFAVR